MGKIKLNVYDHYIVAFSGGKDSLACVLELLDQGVDRRKIELWHHSIDGREGSTLMDWPITESYCRAIANELQIPIYFSWKKGGFEREMNRDKSLTAPCVFEYPDSEDNAIECGLETAVTGIKTATLGGVRGKPNTRKKFPQVAADLRVRWCSAYLKIDVCAKALINQPRFQGKKTLLVTGERAEESKARSKYKTFEPHKTDNREGKRVIRHIDHWRPVHKWDEHKVWGIIKNHQIEPHPAYLLGWGRLSCMTCIFGSANQWASVNAVAQAKLKTISDYEKKFGLTIHRKLSVEDQVAKGTPYASITKELVDLAMSTEYKNRVLNPNWKLPAGAFAESTGPT